MTLPANIPVKQGFPASYRHAPGVFGTLQREIDRLFDDFTPSFIGGGRMSEVAARMDLAETDKGLELSVELPGLEEKDVDVSVSDSMLTVSGEKKFETDKADRSYRVVERGYGSFSRSINLPDGVKAEDVKATLAKGVLKVWVPTPAKAAPKKITVEAAA
jgi:HSP20 family protein